AKASQAAISRAKSVAPPWVVNSYTSVAVITLHESTGRPRTRKHACSPITRQFAQQRRAGLAFAVASRAPENPNSRAPLKVTPRKVLAAAAGAIASRPAFAADPPNILFIVTDDLGYADVSCYGRRDYKTPNIDALAAGGMRFTQAYANSAVCSATRTALITGRYQYRLPVGLEEPIPSASNRVGLPPEHPTLPSLLRIAGYGTTPLAKWHLRTF